jgi:hypothetical protein
MLSIVAVAPSVGGPRATADLLCRSQSRIDRGPRFARVDGLGVAQRPEAIRSTAEPDFGNANH